jgi:hypothetical protein
LIGNRIAFISNSSVRRKSEWSMGASLSFHNAVFGQCGAARNVCDELATAPGIHRGSARHKEFGDVSRHNLILNEMARHSGAGVGRSRVKPLGFVYGLSVARQTA